MDDGADAMRLVRNNLVRLYIAAARADIRRRLSTCCWSFVMVMRTLFRILLVPLIALEYIFISAVWMLRCLITMADTILDRVG